MGFLIIFPSTKHVINDYVFVVYRVSKLVVLAPCKKTITIEGTGKLFFKYVCVHFGFPKTIFLGVDINFLTTLCSNLWSLSKTKITKSTPLHPQISEHTKVVNQITVQLLRMYNFKYPWIWDETLDYLKHNYNRVLQNSIGNNPLEVCLVFQ